MVDGSWDEILDEICTGLALTYLASLWASLALGAVLVLSWAI